MQTGSSGTLIGWKSGPTTYVPLWDQMEGAWLWTLGGFCLGSDIGLVWYSAGVGRTSYYTIITMCCTCFVFALILVWFGTELEWGKPFATPPLQYAARVLSLL